MFSYSPSPSTFGPSLQSCCWRRGKRKIICSVQGVALISTSLPFLLGLFFFFLIIQKAVSNTARYHVARFMGELSFIFLQPKQASTNSLTSVILLGFQTSYDNVVPHIKQYFELHECAYLSGYIEGDKYLCGVHSCS